MQKTHQMRKYDIGVDPSVSSTGVAIKCLQGCNADILIGWTPKKRLLASHKQINAKSCMCKYYQDVDSLLIAFVPVHARLVAKYLGRPPILLARILPYPVLDVAHMSYEERLNKLGNMVIRELTRFIGCTAASQIVVEAPLPVPQRKSDLLLRDFQTVLRLKMFNTFENAQIVELPAGTIKKRWTGNGHAKKPDMYHRFHDQYKALGFPTLHQADNDFFGFPTMHSDKKAEHHPLQDMVDALAAIAPCQAPRSRKKRRAIMIP